MAETMVETEIRKLRADGVLIEEETDFDVARVRGANISVSGLEALRGVFGDGFVDAPNTYKAAGRVELACVSPEEWLVLGPAGAVEEVRVAAGDALEGETALAVSFGGGRVSFLLRGARARDVLSAGAPIDFHARAFERGACARSLYHDVHGFFQYIDDAPTFRLVVERPSAGYVWRLLTEAAGNPVAQA